jgi:cytidine deaminase
LDANELADLVSDSEKSPALCEAQLKYLIEFMRAVHAEMAAITDAALRGVPIAGTTMYVTTFPCHLCAPHIVASGIKRVVYLEPYAKSRAVQLYPESVAVDYLDTKAHQVPFEPFIGVAPRKYIELFTMLPRKKGGKVIQFERATASQRYSASPAAYTASERISIGSLQAAIEKEQLAIEQQELKL